VSAANFTSQQQHEPQSTEAPNRGSFMISSRRARSTGTKSASQQSGPAVEMQPSGKSGPRRQHDGRGHQGCLRAKIGPVEQCGQPPSTPPMAAPTSG
jgi:hypothetical protein